MAGAPTGLGPGLTVMRDEKDHECPGDRGERTDEEAESEGGGVVIVAGEGGCRRGRGSFRGP